MARGDSSKKLGPFYQPPRPKPVWARGISKCLKRLWKKGRKGDFVGCVSPMIGLKDVHAPLKFDAEECGDSKPVYRRPARFAR